jgi:hypothetical protein
MSAVICVDKVKVREGPADGHGVCVAGLVAEPCSQFMLDQDKEREDREEEERSKKGKGMSNSQGKALPSYVIKSSSDSSRAISHCLCTFSTKEEVLIINSLKETVLVPSFGSSF